MDDISAGEPAGTENKTGTESPESTESRESTGSDESGENPGIAESVEVTITDDPAAAPRHKAGAGRLILMRDANNPDGPVLAFTEAEWRAFIAGVKDGEFDDLGDTAP